MNAVSKVLIVLIFLMSVGFAVSQIILFGKRDNYGTKYLEEMDGRVRAQEALKKEEAKNADLTKSAASARQALEAQVAQLEGDLADAKTVADDLRSEGDKLSASLTAMTTNVTSAEALQAEAAKTQEQLRQQILALNATIEEKLAEIAKLDAELADRNGNIDELQHELSETKIAYQKTSNEEERLQAIIGQLVARGVQIPPAPLPVINGRVVRVDNEAMVAVVDRGKVDGVKPNTQFTLYGDGQYVAKLLIDNVQDEVSVGRIVLLQKGRTVVQGLNATTEIQ